jgi:hypothetical protein
MAYTSWKDVPTGEQNALRDLRDQWEKNAGYIYTINDGDLFNIANASNGVSTLADFGKYFTAQLPASYVQAQPWIGLGLTKDVYAGLATSYGTEYQKLTGQTIDASSLAQAFQNVKDPTGNNFLSASQYAEQLQSDQKIQNTYGWVKYGLDYNQFQQHKMAMQQAFGAPPTDQQAVQGLQYWHQNAGANAAVHAANPSTSNNAPATPGTSQSVIR